MEPYKIIGEGKRASYPYEVGIHWEDSSSSQTPRPILLAEGSGHASMGGYFTLADTLADVWTEHLQICGCLRLRELAREEQASGRVFSADEIYARWLAGS